MMRIASEFGLTPASRSRIVTPKNGDLRLLDLFDQLPAEEANAEPVEPGEAAPTDGAD
jgi:phage terminase small subunit